MKQLKIMIICLLSMCILSGCLPHSELDEQAIVEAIGIDYSDGKYEVTVQYFNMEGTGGNSPIDSTKANVVNVSGKGETVSVALESASLKCGKSFMYGITGIIILGRDVLEKDILKTMSFAESYYQSNCSVLIAAADGKASDILAVKFKDGIISVEHLKMLLENADYYGMGENIKITKLLSEQRRDSAGTTLPVFSATQGGETTDDGKNAAITGGILISDRTFTADLSLEDMSGLQLIRKKPENTLVTVSAENENVNVTIYDIDAEIKHSFPDGKLRFDIDIHANGKYTDSQLQNKELAFSSEIEKKCSEILIDRIRSALAATVNQYGCDPVGLKYVISSSDYKNWLVISDNFGEMLKEAQFDITADIDIDRFGIIH